MTLSFVNTKDLDLAGMDGVIVVFSGIDKGWTPQAEKADALTGGALSRAYDAGRFKGKHGEILDMPVPAGMKAVRLLLAGTGSGDIEPGEARTLGGKISGALGELEASGAAICTDGLGDDATVAELALGLRLRRYAFARYKTGKESAGNLGEGAITVAASDAAALEAAAADGAALAEGVFFTRDLVNEPANVLHPEDFADRLAALSDTGLEVEVLDEAAMEKLGMGALLGVGRGSRKQSRLVVMKWLGSDDKSAAPFCVVGKGVTFDTGGISLKPPSGMEEMTMDMGGAGVVSGLMKTLALRKAKANVIGVVGLVENMPDGDAQRPGDIVTSMAGKTIEIINTDAEGRLVLADALYYAQTEFKPAATVNLATLTGAIIIALGHEKAGMFCNDDGFADDLLAAAGDEGEGLWRMPLGKAYDDAIKSRLADMKNTGGRPAGSITAAQFLQRFVDGSPWAHLDIAGVTLLKENKPTHPKGATGWGVATLNRLVRDKFEG